MGDFAINTCFNASCLLQILWKLPRNFVDMVYWQVCRMPSKEQITCQQILLQCFAALGNTHVEFSDSTELAPFTGTAQDDFEDFEDDDDDEMPGLI